VGVVQLMRVVVNLNPLRRGLNSVPDDEYRSILDTCVFRWG